MLNLKNNRTPYRKTNVKTLYKPAFIANEVHLAAPSFIGNNLGIYTRPLCAVYLAKSPLIFLGVSIFLHVEQQIIYKIHKTQLCTYNIYKVQKRKAHNTHRKRRSLTRRRMEVHINLRANKINKRRVFGDSPVENGSEREGALGGSTGSAGTGRGSDRGFSHLYRQTSFSFSSGSLSPHFSMHA